MKTCTQNRTARYKLLGFTAIFALTDSPIPLNAQGPVSAVFSHKENATTTTSYTGTGATGNAASGLTGNSYTYRFGLNVATTNNIAILDSLTAYSMNYHFQTANYVVKFRRVNNASVTGLRKSFRMEQTGGTVAAGGIISMYPDYNDSLELLFTKRILNIGIDNVFQNATTTNNNNIEREDVIFPSSLLATDNTKTGFVVFDWGAAGGHDPFYIAAIKTLDGSGNPASYYPAVSITAAHFGSDKVGSTSYIILRKNPADIGLLMMNNSTAQTRDGVFVRFSDLGVTSYSTIYGYSLFGPDVIVSPATNLVDYTNATNFPITTDLNAVGGGLDPLAVAGVWVTNASYIVLPDLVKELHSSAVNDQVKLNWELYATNDLQEQVVERSGDGVSYMPVLHVPVQGAGPQTAIDTRPLPGRNYYRIKLVQTNGAQAVYSVVSSVDLKTSMNAVLDVYPNPVKNKCINLDISGLNKGSYDILLLDMNGRLALRKTVNGEQSVKTTLQLPHDIANGTYVLQLTDKAGNRMQERRIVVE
jgi:hypothetical protein